MSGDKFLLVFLVALAGCTQSPNTRQIASIVRADYDQAMLDYAGRLNARLKPDEAYEPNQDAAYGIGTILEGANPLDTCKFEPEKIKEHDFAESIPSSMSSTFKVSGSAPKPLSKVFSLLTFKLEDTHTMDLQFLSPTQKIIFGNDLQAIIASPDCQRAIAGRSVEFVRGQILAKRKFIWDKNLSVEASAQSVVGDFTVGYKNGQPVTAEDSRNFPHFILKKRIFAQQVLEIPDLIINEQREAVTRSLAFPQAQRAIEVLPQHLRVRFVQLMISATKISDLVLNLKNLIFENFGFSSQIQAALVAVISAPIDTTAYRALREGIKINLYKQMSSSNIRIDQSLVPSADVYAMEGARAYAESQPSDEGKNENRKSNEEWNFVVKVDPFSVLVISSDDKATSNLGAAGLDGLLVEHAAGGMGAMPHTSRILHGVGGTSGPFGALGGGATIYLRQR